MTQAPVIRPLVAGNWKMNGDRSFAPEMDAIAEAFRGDLKAGCDLLVCPPATLIAEATHRMRQAGVAIGGQTCHSEPKGAFTGEVSAEMLADAGASHVLAGHSERRSLFGETDAAVRSKVLAAHRARLTAVVCVGESEEERRAGKALAVVVGQLAASLPDGATANDTVIAYEPVWAIGTGLTPTAADVAQMHGAIRADLRERFGSEGERMRILYGGSVKPSNAAELMAVPNVNGALIGGASLKAADFLAIAGVYRRKA